MPETDTLTHAIIGCAMKVHAALGPGLLESAYEICLEHELKKAGFSVDRQVPLPVVYDGIRLEAWPIAHRLVDQFPHRLA